MKSSNEGKKQKNHFVLYENRNNNNLMYDKNSFSQSNNKIIGNNIDLYAHSNIKRNDIKLYSNKII